MLEACNFVPKSDDPTTVFTSRKLFGIYFHACVSHSAFLLRLASHCSTNAEMFERLFEEQTDITRKSEKLSEQRSSAYASREDFV